MAKSYILVKFLTFADDTKMEEVVNKYLTNYQDAGYTIVDVKLTMILDKAHKIVITYKT